METKEIYDRNLSTAFKQIKCVREQWEISDKSKSLFPHDNIVCNIDNEETASYNYIVGQCHEITHQMILSIFEELIIKYQPAAKILYFFQPETLFISKYDIEEDVNNIYRNKPKELAFIVNEGNRKVLYCIKKHGLNHQYLNEKVKGLEKFKLSSKRYISLVYENAYCEVINHNDDENDPSRGTEVFSVKWFFEQFINLEEYNLFRSYIDNFSKKINDYIGVSIVRKLTPHSLYSFKEIFLDKIRTFELDSQGFGLDKSRIDSLKEHFYNEENYLAMIGECAFAQSFRTAEWMYQSLKESESIDLTAISMGYFKAIEQLLFSFISMHTLEKDNKNRQIKVYNNLVTLTDSVIVQVGDKISLNNLAKFFGEIDIDNDFLKPRNRDLLYNDIDSPTYEYIVRFISPIVDIRNNYFHKENIIDWSIVENDRETIYKFLFLFFGAYKIADKRAMGITTSEQDDYYKLCEYIHNKSFHDNITLDNINIAVFSFDDDKTVWDCLSDPNIKYDKYGNRTFSGIYFRKQNSTEIKAEKEFHKNTLPKIIKEGYIHIETTNQFNFSVSIPDKVIFKDGKFYGE